MKSNMTLLTLVLLSGCSSMRPVGGPFPGFTQASRDEIQADRDAQPKPRSEFVPMLDMKNVDSSKLYVDLQECQEYGAEVSGAGSGALAGATIGAILGVVISHASGGAMDAGTGASVGAISGGISGGVSGAQNEHQVVSRCMAGRGYSVLSGL